MHRLRTGTFQWAVGIFCVATGTLMCVSPDHFSSPAFVTVYPYIALMGVGFLFTGLALLAMAAFPASQGWKLPGILVYFATAAILFVFVGGFVGTGTWSAASHFVVLSIGTLLLPLLLRRQHRSTSSRHGDFFALLMGLAAVLAGLIMLLLPSQFTLVLYSQVQPWLPWYGLAFMVVGAALTVAQLQPALPRRAFQAIHIGFGLTFYAWLLGVLPPGWVGGSVYAGFGSLVLALPWLEPRLRRVDVASLRVRLVLVLSCVAAFPLITAVAFIIHQETRQATSQALDLQQTVATMVAGDIENYLAIQQAAVTTLAAHPQFFEAAPDKQARVLRLFNRTYPDISAFTIYDAEGRGVVRSDGRPPEHSRAQTALFEQVRRSQSLTLQVRPSLAHQGAVLMIAAPVQHNDNAAQAGGLVTGSLPLRRLTELLTTARLNEADTVYLVDEQGRLLVCTTLSPDHMLMDVAGKPPVAALLTGEEPAGVLRYIWQDNELLAGYMGLGQPDWGVVVERPTAVALQGVTSSRTLAFLILLLAIVAAVGIGSMAAGWLTATLAALVRAVHQLETGCYATPLPRSDISEVARLSAAFLALRDRLAARTVERDQAEAALRVSEERYRTIVETAQEGIWLLDATCHTTFANAALARMLGYDVDEIIGMPITAFAQGDCPLMRMLNANGRCQQTTQHCEIALRRKDGSTLWAMVFINPLQGKYGDLAATLVTVVDITERKTVELELRESEARFRTMADSAPVLIWVSEADGSGIFFNQRWLEFTGRTLQQELGFGWVENLHPDDIPHVGESYKQAANQYKPYTVEFRMRRADGQYRWVIEQGVPRLRPNGTFAGYIGSCIDITERKHTEDMIQFMARASTELTASLDYHTTLASVTRLIVPDLADWCVVDILKEDGSIEQLAVAHADRTREALIRELRQHYPPDPDEPHVIWQVLSSGQSVMKINISDEQLAEHISEPGCLALRRQLGETGYMTVPLRARGRTLGVISFIVGNSGRCYTSKDLALAEELAYRAALAVDNARLYEEAQAAVRARDEFLSIASHELKTPLTALVGYIKLLTRRCEPGTMPTERDIRALRVIDEQSTRLHQLINLLLDMSRIQMGQLTIEPAPLDLAALSKRVACDIELTLEQHTLTLDLPPEPVCIVGDEVRLEQVLQNLLENAIKYSPDGGQVLVRLQQYGDCVLLSVSDEGIGIPGEAMQRLFQRFQRIANPHTCHVSGLGLGLYIVKEIVSLHGGSVDVESSEGRGSTFKVCLPREHPSALPAPAPR